MVVARDAIFKMVHYEAFADYVVYRYKTSLCSKATVTLLIITLLTIIFPLIFTYRSHGFWLKSDTYIEQPDVHFKYDYILILEMDRADLQIVCSSYPHLEYLSNEFNYCPSIMVYEEDSNWDRRYDSLNFQMDVILPATEGVHSVTLLLFFDYRLKSYCWLQMESLAVITYSSPLAGSALDTSADLVLVQHEALRPKHRDSRYNHSIIDEADNSLNLAKILKLYSARSVTTRLENVYSTWTSGRAVRQPFIVTAQILYPETVIRYTPTFWQVIKFAWIQYLSILILFILLFRSLKQFIFTNRLIHTVKEIPWKKLQ